MMRRTLVLMIVPVALALAACQPAAKPADPAPATAPAAEPENPRDMPLPAPGEITGVLSTLNDAGYPMFWAVITPASGAPVAALVNNEDIKAPGEVTALKGKTVKAMIDVRTEADLVQLSVAGKPIYEMERGPDTPFIAPEGAKTITGKVSGATVSGDLASMVTITAKDGTKAVTRAFLNEGQTLKDGATATAMYVENQSAYITEIAEVK
jgi:hypothetical protein